MAIRGVLLDKDGTILDYWKTWVPINREAALFAAGGDRALADDLLVLGGHDPATDIIRAGSVMAAGTTDEVADIFARRLGPKAPPRLQAEIERIFSEGAGRYAVLMQGAIEALDAMDDAGFILGVATNDTLAGTLASLSRPPDLMGRFSFLAACDSGFGAKPEPGMVHAFCAETGLDPDEVAVVGDAIHDLEMGRRAGAGLCIGVLGGTSQHADLVTHADLILDGLHAVPEALLRRLVDEG